MPVFRAFIDDCNVEREILHDRKWPRLLVKPTGEILSVAMAKRIMRLLTQGVSYEEVPVKFREEWNREIDSDTVEAVFEMDFDTTELPVPHGEHLVYPDDPAIEDPEFVCGTIIPSGIYYEIVNLRDYEPSFVEGYVAVRWGFEVTEDMVIEIWDDWMESLPRNEAGLTLIPDGDARPAPPGRLLNDLSNETSEAQDRRSSFSIPPPLYSPRPTWGNMTFRHPREFPGYEGHLPPFHTGFTVPRPPDFASGNPPPTYGTSEAMVEPSYWSTPVPNLPSTQDGPASLPAPSPYQPVLSERKHPGWPICPQVLSKVFTKQDIIDYLYDGIDHGALVYPGGPHEPTQVVFEEAPENPSRIRRILIAAAAERRRAGVRDTLTWRTVEREAPTLWEIIDISMENTVKGLFELLLRDLEERVPYLGDLPPSVNARGLVNHLRVLRGFQVVDLGGDSSTLTAAVLEMLQWKNDPAIILALSFYTWEFAWTFASFTEFVAQVALRRRLLERPAIFPSNQIDAPMTDSVTTQLDIPPLNRYVANQPSPSPLRNVTLMTPPPARTVTLMTPPPVRNVTLMTPAPVSNFTLITPAHSPEANSPEASSDTPNEGSAAHSVAHIAWRRNASRRLLTAEAELFGGEHAARIAQHTRILHRLQDWLAFLTDLPENIEPANPIAELLEGYQDEIDRWRESPNYQPRLWSLGHECEKLLADLEIDTFVRMHTHSPDGTLHWAERFDDWQNDWIRRFEADREELCTEVYCLSNGILRVRPFTAGPFETRVLTHSDIVLELRTVLLWEVFESSPATLEYVETMDPDGDGVGKIIPEDVVDLRFKFRMALLTLDSCMIVPDLTPRDSATNHEEESEESLQQTGNAQHSINDEDGDENMEDDHDCADAAFLERPSAFIRGGQGPPPTPADNTDQPPIRALDLGSTRRNLYRGAMGDSRIVRHLIIHPSPRTSVVPDIDSDSDMSDSDSNSSTGAQRGDSEEFEPGPTGPVFRRPREPLDPTSDGAMQAHRPNTESEEPLHILPPPLRPSLPHLQTYGFDIDGDQEMQLNTPRSGDHERSLQWE